MLKNDTVIKEVMVSHNFDNEKFMQDYCHGSKFKCHPLFSVTHPTLQIFLYFDELEVCNPLGSKRCKHKIGEL
jgi:hypothetical protein